LVSGRASKTIGLPANSHRPPDERLLQDIRSGFQSAFREHRVVVLGNSHHDYTIVAYDAASDMVTLHNPYSNGGFETWSDGGKSARTDEVLLHPVDRPARELLQLSMLRARRARELTAAATILRAPCRERSISLRAR
jgi:hypothetical protein